MKFARQGTRRGEMGSYNKRRSGNMSRAWKLWLAAGAVGAVAAGGARAETNTMTSIYDCAVQRIDGTATLGGG